MISSTQEINIVSLKKKRLISRGGPSKKKQENTVKCGHSMERK